MPHKAPASQDGAEVVNWDCLFTNTVKWGKNQEGQDIVNEYVLLGELGRGSFGRVHLCERRVDSPPWRRFAMKIMSKPRLRRLSEYVNVPGGGMRKVTAEDKVINRSKGLGLLGVHGICWNLPSVSSGKGGVGDESPRNTRYVHG